MAAICKESNDQSRTIVSIRQQANKCLSIGHSAKLALWLEGGTLSSSQDGRKLPDAEAQAQALARQAKQQCDTSIVGNDFLSLSTRASSLRSIATACAKCSSQVSIWLGCAISFFFFLLTFYVFLACVFAHSCDSALLCVVCVRIAKKSLDLLFAFDFAFSLHLPYLRMFALDIASLSVL